MYQQLPQKGILIPNGFTITADAYRYMLDELKGRAKCLRNATAAL
jgi:phosphoenolpyruvate synthase/pyruvate phosphate dikinase